MEQCPSCGERFPAERLTADGLCGRCDFYYGRTVETYAH